MPPVELGGLGAPPALDGSPGGAFGRTSRPEGGGTGKGAGGISLVGKSIGLKGEMPVEGEGGLSGTGGAVGSSGGLSAETAPPREPDVPPLDGRLVATLGPPPVIGCNGAFALLAPADGLFAPVVLLVFGPA